VASIGIDVCTPFPWRRLLEYFSHRLIADAERIEGSTYVRRLAKGEVIVTYDEREHRLHVHCAADATDAAARVARLFVADHDAASIDAHLLQDERLRAFVEACPGLRPLGTWSAFELCCRTVLGQQVTVAAANTLTRRLIERCGVLTPQSVVAADLQSLGMPGKRVATLQTFARAVLDGTIEFASSWSEISTALATLPGFGPWTRTYLAIRLGRDPDAFPATDIGLLRAAGAKSSAELLAWAEAWRPYRAFAAAYLWMSTPVPAPRAAQ
jgi:3-methyladenine DNA glycosylase/8-oxoguanine DNA glycosylase